MKLLHRSIALVLVAVMGAAAFTGCMEDNNNVAEEDLPYGATMKEMKTTFALPMCYDRRFVNDEQAAVIADYFAAVQNCDTELYLQSTFDFYVEYQVNEVYQDSYSSTEEFLAGLRQSMVQPTAEDFRFNMITVSEWTEERVASRLDEMLEMLDALSGQEGFRESVDGCWALKLEWVLTYNGGADSMIAEDQKLYLFEIDGSYYCVM